MVRKVKVDKSYFNNKERPASRKPKRPNRWYRIVNESEYEYVKNSMNYGMFINSVAQIFTLDEEIVQTIAHSSSHTDYVKKITKNISEGKPNGSSTDEFNDIPKQPTDARLPTADSVKGY